MPIIGGGHIWLVMILLAIVLIIWGPGKLPEMGAGMGRAIREFRKATSEMHDTPSTVQTTPVAPVTPVTPVTPQS
jgi:sec-independent protein translocase protein TatA